MKITVLGAGSWGTTVASLVARRHQTMIWARDPIVADEIRLNRRNPRYLSEYLLPAKLDATDDLSKAVGQAELLIVGVPSHAFRETLQAVRPFIHPWIPVVSLTKGLEQGTLLRMTQLITRGAPGPSGRGTDRAEHRPRDHGGQRRGERDRLRGPPGRRRVAAHTAARAAASLHQPRRDRLRTRGRVEERGGDRQRHRRRARGRRQHARRRDDAWARRVHPPRGGDGW